MNRKLSKKREALAPVGKAETEHHGLGCTKDQQKGSRDKPEAEFIVFKQLLSYNIYVNYVAFGQDQKNN